MKHSVFSRLEVLCVLSCFFVIGLVFQAGANLSREQAKRQVCANNIRINATAIVRFAQTHDNYVPYDYNYSPLWLHDLSSTQQTYLSGSGANPYTFFCPSDTGYNNYKNPETSTSVVTSYFWMIVNPYRLPNSPPYGSGDKQWVTTIDVAHPATTELVTDSQFSDGLQPDSNYAYVIAGFNYLDYTNHRQGTKGCAGGNIGFVDTHVQWRPFSQMEYRWRASGGSPNPYQWW